MCPSGHIRVAAAGAPPPRRRGADSLLTPAVPKARPEGAVMILVVGTADGSQGRAFDPSRRRELTPRTDQARIPSGLLLADGPVDPVWIDGPVVCACSPDRRRASVRRPGRSASPGPLSVSMAGRP